MNDRCIRCGKVVPWDHSVCRDCNPANLPSPSPTQLHATVYLAVLAAMVVLAVVLVARG
jgi:predicted nucleic acid-binding Zn ribbon protein